MRHGETQWNRDARIQGQLDIELSEAGQAQADLLAMRLGRVALDAVYSSDLARARVTAERVAAQHGLGVRLAPEFREIHFGEWQGLGWREVDARYPGAREGVREDPVHSRPPGGETWPEVAERVMLGLASIAREWPSGKVAVVSHGGTGRMVLCSVLGIDIRSRWKLRMDNTGISTLEHDGRDWSVAGMNDCCHLTGAIGSGHDD